MSGRSPGADPLFTDAEVAGIRARELPRATARATVQDLEGAVLFGAGRFSRALLVFLGTRNVRPAWIVDSNPALWGQRLLGIEIRPAASLSEARDRLVLLLSTFLKPMADACRLAGVKRWAWYTDITEVFGNQAITTTCDEVLAEPEVHRLWRLLGNCGESRHVFRQALTCRITGEEADLPPVTPGQYFAGDWIPDAAYSRFLDCGAFDGDTLEAWVARYGRRFPPSQLRYHAIEPDPANFSRLASRVAGLAPEIAGRVSLHPCAVGEATGSIRMIQGGPGSSLYSGLGSGLEVPVVPIDRLLAGERVTAVKMDLEGFEPKALEGARELIGTQRPVLLISVYHRVEHLWQLPLWIHDLGLGYGIRLRHHARSSSETVCYAVPEPA